MKHLLAGVLICAALISFEARAQDRANDAALGALSGAVVLGPIGAMAGALVGYTAGPSIATAWGLRRPEPRYRARRMRQSNMAPMQSTAVADSSPPTARPLQPSRSRRPPPAQGFE